MNENELRQMFVNKAIEYIGTAEGGSKHKYIIDTYNKIVPLPVGYKVTYTDSWCATFVSFVAKECGLLDIIPAECGCQRQIALWQKMGRWQENDGYVPKAGDVIYYDWQDNGVGDNQGHSDHVGIVVGVSSGVIKVIEGNKSDTVGYRNIAVDGKFIRGFGLPKFSSKVTSKVPAPIISTESKRSVCEVELRVLRQGNKNRSVKALQILLIGYGYSCGKSGADGDFGSATYNAVIKFQGAKGLAQDGIVGARTWGKLLG